MAVKVLRSVRMGFGYAMRRGMLRGNPATDAKLQRRARAEELVEIPTKAEIRAILLAAKLCDDAGVTHYGEALVTLALFSGLRISELLALGRNHLSIAPGQNTAHKVTVARRADEKRRLGPPKSAAARRDVPIGPATVLALRVWLKRMPAPMHAGDAELVRERGRVERQVERLVFPTGEGTVESYANVYHRVWTPILIVAGVVDANGGPKYGLHVMRHAAVSIWIEQRLNQKLVQARIGHADLKTTLDLYGHLWPDEDAAAASAAASERVILGSGGNG